MPSSRKVWKLIVAALTLLLFFQICSWAATPKTPEEFALELQTAAQTVRNFCNNDLLPLQRTANSLHVTFELEIVPAVNDVIKLLQVFGVDVSNLEKSLERNYVKINSSIEQFRDDLDTLVYSASFISENLRINSTEVMPSTLDYYKQFNKELVIGMRLVDKKITTEAAAARKNIYDSVNSVRDRSARTNLREKFKNIEIKVKNLWQDLKRVKSNFDNNNVMVIKILKKVIL